MPLDDLVSVIETLQQRIISHRQSLQQNEIRTRTALIDPLLTALGWDVSDPAVVTPEYSVGEGRADYALNGSEAIPAAMVEAKRLGHALNDEERMQMLNYANARGVRYAAVTDGNAWELYEVFKQAPLEDRRLLIVRIVGSPAHELALQLLMLWRPNVASGQPVEAVEPLIASAPVSQTAMTAAAEMSSIIEAPRPILSEPVSIEPGWVSLPDFNPPGGSKPPAAIRFPDGSLQGIRRWNDILTAVATWLNASGKLTTSHMPVQSSPKTYIVHTRPQHPTGNEFFLHREIPNASLVVNTHGSAIQMRKNSRTLLEHCHVDPATVQLQVGG